MDNIDVFVHDEHGLSAYEIAVKQGFIGSVDEWLDSLKDEKGEPGEPGKDGINGKNGLNGINGVNGKDGITPDMSDYYNKTEIDSLIGDIESLLGGI